METNREMLKALVLYVIWKTSHLEDFGATKLNKVLWFSEARTFEAMGRPIAGETFVRDQFGPRSKNLREICSKLVSEGLVERFTEFVGDYELTRYRALQPADTSMFSSEQLNFVDWWISAIADKHTAVSISQLSHDYGWQVAGMGEELPLHAFLAKRIRQPHMGEELDWAKAEAARLGLR